MSKLADLGVSTSIVTTAKGPISLRGLSFADFTILAANHGPELEVLFGSIPAPKEGQSLQDMALDPEVQARVGSDFISKILTVAPSLCAGIIACSVDEGGDADAVAAAYRLPVGLQVTLLTEAITLTFADGGGAKKVIETVVRAIGMATLDAPPVT